MPNGELNDNQHTCDHGFSGTLEGLEKINDTLSPAFSVCSSVRFFRGHRAVETELRAPGLIELEHARTGSADDEPLELASTKLVLAINYVGCGARAYN